MAICRADCRITSVFIGQMQPHILLLPYCSDLSPSPGSDRALMHSLPPSLPPSLDVLDKCLARSCYQKRGHWQFHALLLSNSITGSQAERCRREENN